jgi:MarR family transcriptional regulator, transcriptional regulator for hemolysin
MLVADKELKDVAFFSIDQAIRQMHKFTIRRFHEKGFDITVDQWLVLKRVSDADGVISQSEIATLLEKDNASMTRILDILVKKELLFRQMSASDRRRFDLVMTEKGVDFVRNILPVVKEIRKAAFDGISEAEILVLQNVLGKLKNNLL